MLPKVGECVYVDIDLWWDQAATQTLQRRYLKHVAVVERIDSGGKRGKSNKNKSNGAGIKLSLRYFYRPHQTFHPPSHAFYEKVRTLSFSFGLAFALSRCFLPASLHV